MSRTAIILKNLKRGRSIMTEYQDIQGLPLKEGFYLWGIYATYVSRDENSQWVCETPKNTFVLKAQVARNLTQMVNLDAEINHFKSQASFIESKLIKLIQSREIEPKRCPYLKDDVDLECQRGNTDMTLEYADDLCRKDYTLCPIL